MQQELDKIMVELQEQLYELQDFLYCIKLDIKNVFLELQDDCNNIRHCDFDASVPRLIQLLTGTNIYCHEYSFVRELIQNSIDAISFWDKQKEPGEKFRKSIEIELGCDEEKREYFKIRDYGIGMKREIIEQYFATLGKSYYKEYTERRNINYNSVSNFGIGFLSVFKPCNRIIIKTKHFVEDKYHKMEIISDRGHYTISSCTQPDFLPGTEITCYFKRSNIDEKAIIDYIKEIMLDIKYSINIQSGVGSGNERNTEIQEREIRQEKYKNKMFVPFDEDNKSVAKLENEESDLYSFRHGILIRPEHEKHAGVDILSAGILLKNAGLDDIFGEKMESLHYMKVTMNFPPNWLDIDVFREKVNGIREGYIKNAKDFKEDIYKELKRQVEEAFQKKNFFGIGSALTNLNELEAKEYLNTMRWDLIRHRTEDTYDLKPVTNMSYQKCTIEDKVQLKENLYKIKLSKWRDYEECRETAGKFYFIMISEIGEKPFALFSYENREFIVKRVGAFTEEFTKLKIGDTVFIRGPYGKDIVDYQESVINLVGGGTGISPLYEIARKYAKNNKIRFFLGGKEQADIFEKELFEKIGEINIVTEDGSLGIKGNISDLLLNYNFPENEKQIFVNVGPKVMIEKAYEFEKNLADEADIWVSIEYQTSCGVGICGKCATEQGVLSCVDGPFLKVSDALKIKECRHN